MKEAYYTIFTQTNDCVLVEVPDMQIVTEGKTIAEAIEMARDAIGLKGITIEDMGEPIPKAGTKIDSENGIFKEEGRSIVSLVDVDFDIYRKMQDDKMVRRNVTLPNWLNQSAEKARINVSRVLQEALMEKLGVHR